ncbi:adenosylcobinamide-phosphate synthase CbiB [Pseudomonas sp.]|uniref:adenosylcobinamide-phosphate synthase CbiB n=1 Tax=Pseudomonas sp. TaxID=306 RepID=UPI00272D6537|nr:adenosylcobinamide-phosphate synthase CbiB [Pseudomonas sp.]
MTLPLMAAALVLDRLFGEPRRRHPLVGFGKLAGRIEARFNRPGASRGVGLLAWLIAVLPLSLSFWLLARLPYLGWLIELLVLYLAIGLRSLCDHAQAVSHALDAGDLSVARERVGFMVSRQTDQLDETGVALATTESVLENGSDAVFAALFWFVLLGGFGAVLYRLANTLDAMWGYRNARFQRFGWAAARLDDLLNYIPARLVALTYVLCGNLHNGLRCWRGQAAAWDSPNAGPVMAAGAGALGVTLGGRAIYGGVMHERPLLGCGAMPTRFTIDAALQLVERGVLLWLAVGVILWGLSNA